MVWTASVYFGEKTYSIMHVVTFALLLAPASALRVPRMPLVTAAAPCRRAAPVQLLFGKTEKSANTSKQTGLEPAEKATDAKAMMKKVKAAGKAGIFSYIFWELVFWGISAPVACFGYLQVAGHWPDLSNQDDLAKLGAEAFAFVNFARFAVPLRFGLALATTPWFQANVVDKLELDKKA
jgi:hypothetical protein